MSPLLERPSHERAYIPTSALATAVEFTDGLMHGALTNGRIVSIPILWFPRLRSATPEQSAHYEIGAGGRGLYWPDLDEDIAVAGLLAGGDEQAR